MANFLRVVQIALQYRLTLVGIALCSLLVAVLFGANIGATYPLVEIVFSGRSVPQWVDHEIAATQDKIDGLNAEIADLQAQRAAADQTPAADQIDVEIQRRQSRLKAEQQAHQWAARLQPYAHRYLPDQPFATLALIVGMLVVGTLLKAVFLVGNLILVERLANLVTFDLRKQFYRRTLRMDLAAFGEDRTPRLLSRFTNDMSAVTGGISTVFGKLLREPLKAAVFLGCAAWICWPLLLFSLIVSPLVIFLVARLASSIKRANRRAMEEMAQLYSHLAETLSSIEVVKAYTMEAHERNRFHQMSKEYFRKSMKIATYDGLTKPLTELMGLTIVALAILAGGYLVLNDTTDLLGIPMTNRPLDFGSIMAFYGFLIALSDPARKMTDVFAMLQRALAASDRVFEMMDRQPAIVEPVHPQPLPTMPAELVFDKVTFSYAHNPPALQNISLTVPFGQSLAIVGPNGCGKTTLAKLVPRFYDPTAGEVRLGGVSLRDLPIKQLRRQIGFVIQQTVLFDDTIMNNIRYGAPGASDEQVIEAAKQAHAHGFITEKLDRGYEAIVGEGGGHLSGGQRQRIALARAILRDPKILILDEATSQVDPHSEQLIHHVLERFKVGRTTIMVTHRLSTLQLADQILVMEGGKIVNAGTFDQLAEQCPLFQKLYQNAWKASA